MASQDLLNIVGESETESTVSVKNANEGILSDSVEDTGAASQLSGQTLLNFEDDSLPPSDQTFAANSWVRNPSQEPESLGESPCGHFSDLLNLDLDTSVPLKNSIPTEGKPLIFNILDQNSLVNDLHEDQEKPVLAVATNLWLEDKSSDDLLGIFKSMEYVNTDNANSSNIDLLGGFALADYCSQTQDIKGGLKSQPFIQAEGIVTSGGLLDDFSTFLPESGQLRNLISKPVKGPMSTSTNETENNPSEADDGIARFLDGLKPANSESMATPSSRQQDQTPISSEQNILDIFGASENRNIETLLTTHTQGTGGTDMEVKNSLSVASSSLHGTGDMLSNSVIFEDVADTHRCSNAAAKHENLLGIQGVSEDEDMTSSAPEDLSGPGDLSFLLDQSSFSQLQPELLEDVSIPEIDSSTQRSQTDKISDGELSTPATESIPIISSEKLTDGHSALNLTTGDPDCCEENKSATIQKVPRMDSSNCVVLDEGKSNVTLPENKECLHEENSHHLDLISPETSDQKNDSGRDLDQKQTGEILVAEENVSSVVDTLGVYGLKQDSEDSLKEAQASIQKTPCDQSTLLIFENKEELSTHGESSKQDIQEFDWKSESGKDLFGSLEQKMIATTGGEVCKEHSQILGTESTTVNDQKDEDQPGSVDIWYTTESMNVVNETESNVVEDYSKVYTTSTFQNANVLLDQISAIQVDEEANPSSACSSQVSLSPERIDPLRVTTSTDSQEFLLKTLTFPDQLQSDDSSSREMGNASPTGKDLPYQKNLLEVSGQMESRVRAEGALEFEEEKANIVQSALKENGQGCVDLQEEQEASGDITGTEGIELEDAEQNQRQPSVLNDSSLPQQPTSSAAATGIGKGESGTLQVPVNSQSEQLSNGPNLELNPSKCAPKATNVEQVQPLVVQKLLEADKRKREGRLQTDVISSVTGNKEEQFVEDVLTELEKPEAVDGTVQAVVSELLQSVYKSAAMELNLIDGDLQVNEVEMKTKMSTSRDIVNEKLLPISTEKKDSPISEEANGSETDNEAEMQMDTSIGTGFIYDVTETKTTAMQAQLNFLDQSDFGNSSTLREGVKLNTPDSSNLNLVIDSIVPLNWTQHTSSGAPLAHEDVLVATNVTEPKQDKYTDHSDRVILMRAPNDTARTDSTSIVADNLSKSSKADPGIVDREESDLTLVDSPQESYDSDQPAGRGNKSKSADLTMPRGQELKERNTLELFEVLTTPEKGDFAAQSNLESRFYGDTENVAEILNSNASPNNPAKSEPADRVGVLELDTLRKSDVFDSDQTMNQSVGKGAMNHDSGEEAGSAIAHASNQADDLPANVFVNQPDQKFEHYDQLKLQDGIQDKDDDFELLSDSEVLSTAETDTGTLGILVSQLAKEAGDDKQDLSITDEPRSDETFSSDQIDVSSEWKDATTENDQKDEDHTGSVGIWSTSESMDVIDETESNVDEDYSKANTTSSFQNANVLLDQISAFQVDEEADQSSACYSQASLSVTERIDPFRVTTSSDSEEFFVKPLTFSDQLQSNDSPSREMGNASPTGKDLPNPEDLLEVSGLIESRVRAEGELQFEEEKVIIVQSALKKNDRGYFDLQEEQETSSGDITGTELEYTEQKQRQPSELNDSSLPQQPTSSAAARGVRKGESGTLQDPVDSQSEQLPNGPNLELNPSKCAPKATNVEQVQPFVVLKLLKAGETKWEGSFQTDVISSVTGNKEEQFVEDVLTELEKPEAVDGTVQAVVSELLQSVYKSAAKELNLFDGDLQVNEVEMKTKMSTSSDIVNEKLLPISTEKEDSPSSEEANAPDTDIEAESQMDTSIDTDLISDVTETKTTAIQAQLNFLDQSDFGNSSTLHEDVNLKTPDSSNLNQVIDSIVPLNWSQHTSSGAPLVHEDVLVTANVTEPKQDKYSDDSERVILMRAPNDTARTYSTSIVADNLSQSSKGDPGIVDHEESDLTLVDSPQESYDSDQPAKRDNKSKSADLAMPRGQELEESSTLELFEVLTTPEKGDFPSQSNLESRLDGDTENVAEILNSNASPDNPAKSKPADRVVGVLELDTLLKSDVFDSDQTTNSSVGREAMDHDFGERAGGSGIAHASNQADANVFGNQPDRKFEHDDRLKLQDGIWDKDEDFELLSDSEVLSAAETDTGTLGILVSQLAKEASDKEQDLSITDEPRSDETFSSDQIDVSSEWKDAITENDHKDEDHTALLGIWSTSESIDVIDETETNVDEDSEDYSKANTTSTFQNANVLLDQISAIQVDEEANPTSAIYSQASLSLERIDPFRVSTSSNSHELFVKPLAFSDQLQSDDSPSRVTEKDLPNQENLLGVSGQIESRVCAEGALQFEEEKVNIVQSALKENDRGCFDLQEEQETSSGDITGTEGIELEYAEQKQGQPSELNDSFLPQQPTSSAAARGIGKGESGTLQDPVDSQSEQLPNLPNLELNPNNCAPETTNVEQVQQLVVQKLLEADETKWEGSLQNNVILNATGNKEEQIVEHLLTELQKPEDADSTVHGNHQTLQAVMSELLQSVYKSAAKELKLYDGEGDLQVCEVEMETKTSWPIVNEKLPISTEKDVSPSSEEATASDTEAETQMDASIDTGFISDVTETKTTAIQAQLNVLDQSDFGNSSTLHEGVKLNMPDSSNLNLVIDSIVPLNWSQHTSSGALLVHEDVLVTTNVTEPKEVKYSDDSDRVILMRAPNDTARTDSTSVVADNLSESSKADTGVVDRDESDFTLLESYDSDQPAKRDNKSKSADLAMPRGQELEESSTLELFEVLTTPEKGDFPSQSNLESRLDGDTENVAEILNSNGSPDNPAKSKPADRVGVLELDTLLKSDVFDSDQTTNSSVGREAMDHDYGERAGGSGIAHASNQANAKVFGNQPDHKFEHYNQLKLQDGIRDKDDDFELLSDSEVLSATEADTGTLGIFVSQLAKEPGDDEQDLSITDEQRSDETFSSEQIDINSEWKDAIIENDHKDEDHTGSLGIWSTSESIDDIDETETNVDEDSEDYSKANNTSTFQNANVLLDQISAIQVDEEANPSSACYSQASLSALERIDPFRVTTSSDSQESLVKPLTFSDQLPSDGFPSRDMGKASPTGKDLPNQENLLEASGQIESAKEVVADEQDGWMYKDEDFELLSDSEVLSTTEADTGTLGIPVSQLAKEASDDEQDLSTTDEPRSDETKQSETFSSDQIDMNSDLKDAVFCKESDTESILEPNSLSGETLHEHGKSQKLVPHPETTDVNAVDSETSLSSTSGKYLETESDRSSNTSLDSLDSDFDINNNVDAMVDDDATTFNLIRELVDNIIFESVSALSSVHMSSEEVNSNDTVLTGDKPYVDIEDAADDQGVNALTTNDDSFHGIGSQYIAQDIPKDEQISDDEGEAGPDCISIAQNKPDVTQHRVQDEVKGFTVEIEQNKTVTASAEKLSCHDDDADDSVPPAKLSSPPLIPTSKKKNRTSHLDPELKSGPCSSILDHKAEISEDDASGLVEIPDYGDLTNQSCAHTIVTSSTVEGVLENDGDGSALLLHETSEKLCLQLDDLDDSAVDQSRTSGYAEEEEEEDVMFMEDQALPPLTTDNMHETSESMQIDESHSESSKPNHAGPLEDCSELSENKKIEEDTSGSPLLNFSTLHNESAETRPELLRSNVSGEKKDINPDIFGISGFADISQSTGNHSADDICENAVDGETFEDQSVNQTGYTANRSDILPTEDNVPSLSGNQNTGPDNKSDVPLNIHPVPIQDVKGGDVSSFINNDKVTVNMGSVDGSNYSQVPEPSASDGTESGNFRNQSALISAIGEKEDSDEESQMSEAFVVKEALAEADPISEFTNVDICDQVQEKFGYDDTEGKDSRSQRDFNHEELKNDDTETGDFQKFSSDPAYFTSSAVMEFDDDELYPNASGFEAQKSSITSNAIKKALNQPAQTYTAASSHYVPVTGFSSTVPSSVFIDKDLISDNEDDEGNNRGNVSSSSDDEKEDSTIEDGTLASEDEYGDRFLQSFPVCTARVFPVVTSPYDQSAQYDPSVPDVKNYSYEAYDTDWEELLMQVPPRFPNLPVIMEEAEPSDAEESHGLDPLIPMNYDPSKDYCEDDDNISLEDIHYQDQEDYGLTDGAQENDDSSITPLISDTSVKDFGEHVADVHSIPVIVISPEPYESRDTDYISSEENAEAVSTVTRETDLNERNIDSTLLDALSGDIAQNVVVEAFASAFKKQEQSGSSINADQSEDHIYLVSKEKEVETNVSATYSTDDDQIFVASIKVPDTDVLVNAKTEAIFEEKSEVYVKNVETQDENEPQTMSESSVDAPVSASDDELSNDELPSRHIVEHCKAAENVFEANDTEASFADISSNSTANKPFEKVEVETAIITMEETEIEIPISEDHVDSNALKPSDLPISSSVAIDQQKEDAAVLLPLKKSPELLFDVSNSNVSISLTELDPQLSKSEDIGEIPVAEKAVTVPPPPPKRREQKLNEFEASDVAKPLTEENDAEAPPPTPVRKKKKTLNVQNDVEPISAPHESQIQPSTMSVDEENQSEMGLVPLSDNSNKSDDMALSQISTSSISGSEPDQKRIAEIQSVIIQGASENKMVQSSDSFEMPTSITIFQEQSKENLSLSETTEVRVSSFDKDLGLVSSASFTQESQVKNPTDAPEVTSPVLLQMDKSNVPIDEEYLVGGNDVVSPKPSLVEHLALRPEIDMESSDKELEEIQTITKPDELVPDDSFQYDDQTPNSTSDILAVNQSDNEMLSPFKVDPFSLSNMPETTHVASPLMATLAQTESDDLALKVEESPIDSSKPRSAQEVGLGIAIIASGSTIGDHGELEETPNDSTSEGSLSDDSIQESSDEEDMTDRVLQTYYIMAQEVVDHLLKEVIKLAEDQNLKEEKVENASICQELVSDILTQVCSNLQEKNIISEYDSEIMICDVETGDILTVDESGAQSQEKAITPLSITSEDGRKGIPDVSENPIVSNQVDKDSTEKLETPQTPCRIALRDENDDYDGSEGISEVSGVPSVADQLDNDDTEMSETPHTHTPYQISLRDENDDYKSRKSRRKRYDTTGSIGSIRYLTDSEEEDESLQPAIQSQSPEILISLVDDAVVDEETSSSLKTPELDFSELDDDHPHRRKSLIPPSSLVLSVALDDIDLTEKENNQSDIAETPVSARLSFSSSLTGSQTSLASSTEDGSGGKRSKLPNLPMLRPRKPSEPTEPVIVKTKLELLAQENIIPIVAKPESRRFVKWENVTIKNIEYRIDETAIQPYKKVVAHGGFYSEKSAIIEIFTSYLPPSNTEHYAWVMDNLFLYVLATVELLALEKFSVVLFVGSTPKSQVPANSLLKRWHEHVDYRLKKNVEAFYIVNPTFYFRTMAMFFVSRKVMKKMKYVKNMAELKKCIPTDFLFVPPEIAK